jgi:hypothetical protein
MGYHIDSCETLSFWSTYSIRAIGPLAIGPLLDIYGTRSRLLLHYASRMSEVCLLIAARVDTAIRYMEANPGEDSGQFMERMAEEVVSNANYMFIHFRI